MINIKGFDYILFKDEEGRSFARIKRTNEIVEVSDEVMKLLRSYEKQQYRENEEIKNLNSANLEKRTKASITYPYYYLSEFEEDELESFVLADPNNFEDNIFAKDLEESFSNLLTENQREVFYYVLLGGEKESEFARRKNITDRAVRRTIEMIQKKAKKFFR